MQVHDCLLCGKELTSTPSWRFLFERFPPVICPRCQQAFERTGQTYRPLLDLQVQTLFHYNEAMVDYFHRYKFMHDTILAHVFRKELHELLKGKTVVPIPMHPKKLQERTFAQVELLLRAASIPYEQLLTKTTTDTQGTKTKQQRLQTPQIFELLKQPVAKSYVLFDDIVTTGMTLHHAKTLLLQGGAKEVACVTLIQA